MMMSKSSLWQQDGRKMHNVLSIKYKQYWYKYLGENGIHMGTQKKQNKMGHHLVVCCSLSSTERGRNPVVSKHHIQPEYGLVIFRNLCHIFLASIETLSGSFLFYFIVLYLILG